MTAPTTAPAAQVKLVLAAAFLAYLAQMTLVPIIAPLSREVGLAEWQVGVTISTAAVMVVLTSQRWGRLSQSWGRKRVLIAALSLGAIATAAFAVVSQLGITGALTGTALFILFLALRGVGFGTAIAAVQPTAQAYIAEVTPDEAARVKGMASVGAVQGIAQIAGAVFGGLLAVFGLMVPIVAVPVLLALGVLLVATQLRTESRTTLIPKPASVRPTDPRVWPFLVAGFGMFSALAVMQIVMGFLIQDRFRVDANTTAILTGAAMLAAGIGMILAQAVVVPKTKWSPATLMRVGGLTALIGFLALIPDAGLPLLFGSLAVIGLGIGTAMPGFSAGPTLLVSREEQGGVAGLTAAMMGLTFVVAPTAGTVLYGIWPPLPISVSATLLAAVTLFALLHPRFALKKPEVS